MYGSRRHWATDHEANARDAVFLRSLRTVTDEELSKIARNYQHKNASLWKKIAIGRELLRRKHDREDVSTIPAPPPVTYRTYRCIDCGGVAHPATGCVYSENAISCWRCTLRFWEWARSHTNKKARRRAKQIPTELSFYEAAGKWTKDRS